MRLDYKGIGHPTQRQLVDFAESLVDEGASVSAALAAHVAECATCAREVRNIRACFKLANLCNSPAPSTALTQEIVFRARGELNKRSHPYKGGTVFRAVQYLVCAAGLIVLAVYSFHMALDDAAAHAREPGSGSAMSLASEPAVSAKTLLQRADAVKALSASVSIREKTPDSPREAEYRRALEVFNHDLNAALSALQRNPGSVRANQVMVMSLEQQLEGLRDLYLDRTF